mmetsp:Transcript_40225/g.97006  ORF Transcript_40225/g.97006 Transcript_40225/m.97006 type:complete len:211 (-) Transcript_40225:255-887(-)
MQLHRDLPSSHPYPSPHTEDASGCMMNPRVWWSLLLTTHRPCSLPSRPKRLRPRMPKTSMKKRRRFMTSMMDGRLAGTQESSSCVPLSDLICLRALSGRKSRRMRTRREMSAPEKAATGTRIHDMRTMKESKRFQLSAKYPLVISGSSSGSMGGLKPSPNASILSSISPVKMLRMIQSAASDTSWIGDELSRSTQVLSSAMIMVLTKMVP